MNNKALVIRSLIQSIVLVFLVFWFFKCSYNYAEKQSGKIDRFALVNRHNVSNNEFDPLNSLSVGNGEFAFTVDATGLQTFPEKYDNGVCLGTQSEWGWHSFPNSENYRLEESYQYYEVEGRQIPYAVQREEPGRKQEAANYFRANPHRLHLGIIGLERRMVLSQYLTRIQCAGNYPTQETGLTFNTVVNCFQIVFLLGSLTTYLV